MCERAGDPRQGLAAAIDALAALDPDDLANGDLHEVVIGLEREASRLAAARARLVSAWDARRVWADDESRSAAARLLARDEALLVDE